MKTDTKKTDTCKIDTQKTDTQKTATNTIPDWTANILETWNPDIPILKPEKYLRNSKQLLLCINCDNISM